QRRRALGSRRRREEDRRDEDQQRDRDEHEALGAEGDLDAEPARRQRGRQRPDARLAGVERDRRRRGPRRESGEDARALVVDDVDLVLARLELIERDAAVALVALELPAVGLLDHLDRLAPRARLVRLSGRTQPGGRALLLERDRVDLRAAQLELE